MCQLEIIWQKAESSDWDESFEESYKEHLEEIKNFLNEHAPNSVLDTIIFGFLEFGTEEDLIEIGNKIAAKFPDKIKWCIEEDLQLLLKLNNSCSQEVYSFIEENFENFQFDMEDIHPGIGNTFFENHHEAKQFVDKNSLSVADPLAKENKVLDVSEIDAQIQLLLKQKEELLKKKQLDDEN